MKKTFIRPAMEVVKIETQGVIAASIPGGGSTDQNLGREMDWEDLLLED